MKKKFLTNLGLILFLNLLIKPYWIFGIERNVQNLAGSEAYGLYFSLFSFSVILNILLDFGTTNYNNRIISQNPKLLSFYFSNILVLRFFLGIVYFIIACVIGILIGYDVNEFKILLILLLNQALALFLLYLRSNISGMQYYRTDSLMSVFDRLLMIIFCTIIIYSFNHSKAFNILWFAFAQTASYSIACLLAFFIIVGKMKFLRPRMEPKKMLIILKQSLPFALLTLLMGVYTRIDFVFLERLLIDGDKQAGIYAQAFRINDALSMLPFLFAGLLLPMYSKMLKTGDSVESLTKMSFSLIMIPVACITIASVFYSRSLMTLLYTDHIDEASDVFQLLILNFLPFSITYIFGSLLTANGNLKTLNSIGAIAVFLNITLNLYLIPQYKALGAASASIITQLFTATAQIYFVWKIFKFKDSHSFFLKYAIYISLLIGIGFLCKHYIELEAAGFLILIAMGIILSLALKLINLSGIIDILKE